MQGEINILRNGMSELSENYKNMKSNYDYLQKDHNQITEKLETVTQSWISEINLNKQLQKQLNSNKATEADKKELIKQFNILNGTLDEESTDEEDADEESIDEEDANLAEKDFNKYGLHGYHTRKNLKHIKKQKNAS